MKMRLRPRLLIDNAMEIHLKAVQGNFCRGQFNRPPATSAGVR